MIDTKELRLLAQAATPGPWINHGRQPNVAGLPHSAVAAKTLLARVYSEAYGDVGQETANASLIAAANPAAITELLDRLEAAEKSDAESIVMYRKARDERDTLRAKIETAENDAAHQKALAASALRVAKGWERKCGELRAEVIYWKEQKEPGAAGWRALARILQAKIEQMEKQEPVGGMLEVSPHNYELRWYRPVPFGTKLYTLPGAQPAPSIPEGWKLAPIEPTEEMTTAFARVFNVRDQSGTFTPAFRAALAAAPEAKP